METETPLSSIGRIGLALIRAAQRSYQNSRGAQSIDYAQLPGATPGTHGNGCWSRSRASGRTPLASDPVASPVKNDRAAGETGVTGGLSR